MTWKMPFAGPEPAKLRKGPIAARLPGGDAANAAGGQPRSKGKAGGAFMLGSCFSKQDLPEGAHSCRFALPGCCFLWQAAAPAGVPRRTATSRGRRIARRTCWASSLGRSR